MDEYIQGDAPAMSLSSHPALQPHLKLRRDTVRDRWVILAPERILTPNEQAAETLLLCDGKRTVAEIAGKLAETYDADPDAIASDILGLLQGLADAGVVRP